MEREEEGICKRRVPTIGEAPEAYNALYKTASPTRSIECFECTYASSIYREKTRAFDVVSQYYTVVVVVVVFGDFSFASALQI